VSDSIERFERMLPLLHEVTRERERQDQKWGEQNHPMIRPGDLGYFERAMDGSQAAYETAEANGTVAWSDILLEEVYEALAETDIEKQKVELIQVAAVALSMIECLDRKANGHLTLTQ